MLENPEITLRPSHSHEEHTVLVDVWRSAVRATHAFLLDEDFERIEADLESRYFPAVSLIIAERSETIVGFAGIAADTLEMLFVANDSRGQGVGTLLLDEAISTYGITKVDVNEQNEGAHKFYLSRSFIQVGRDELDGNDRPYPILHLELQSDR